MKVSRKRVLFQGVLHLVLVLHVVGYYAWGWTSVGSLDFQSFFHDGLSRGLLTAGALLALAAIVGTLVFGRLFCSWGCHFAAVQDVAAWALRRLGWKAPVVHTRFLHWIPYLLLLVIFAAPAIRAHLERGAPPEIAMDLSANAPWATFPGFWGSLITFAACGAGILLFLGTRGFCRFVCPYGAMFRIFDRAAPFRVRRQKECSGSCPGSSGAPGAGVAPCTGACPMAIDVHQEARTLGRVVDVDCVRCHLCIEACPEQALAYSTRGVPAQGTLTRPPRSLTLAEEIGVLAFTALAYLAWDMVIAAHFLAATLALGLGFLALICWRAARSRDFRVLGRLDLRRQGRWTPAGSLLLAALVISLVPLARGLSFKWLEYRGDRSFDVIFSEVELDEPVLPGPAVPGLAGPDRTALTSAGAIITRLERSDERGEALREARESYRRALALFPDQRGVRKKYALVLITERSPEALEQVRILESHSDDPGIRKLRELAEAHRPPPRPRQDPPASEPPPSGGSN